MFGTSKPKPPSEPKKEGKSLLYRAGQAYGVTKHLVQKATPHVKRVGSALVTAAENYERNTRELRKKERLLPRKSKKHRKRKAIKPQWMR